MGRLSAWINLRWRSSRCDLRICWIWLTDSQVLSSVESVRVVCPKCLDDSKVARGLSVCPFIKSQNFSHNAKRNSAKITITGPRWTTCCRQARSCLLLTSPPDLVKTMLALHRCAVSHLRAGLELATHGEGTVKQTVFKISYGALKRGCCRGRFIFIWFRFGLDSDVNKRRPRTWIRRRIGTSFVDGNSTKTSQ